MKRFVGMAAVLVGALIPSGLATAAEENCRPLYPGQEDSPVVCREQNWFHAADVPVGNVGAIPGQGNPSWDTAAPTDEGPGALALGESYVGTQLTGSEDYVNELVFEGTFTGNLDTVAVSLHADQYLWAFCEAVCAERDGVAVALTVDGHVLYETEGDWDTVPIEEGEVSQRLDFAFTDLYERLAAEGITHPGFIHAIKLRIRPSNVHAAVIYWYDSVEFPSGLVFNAEPDELSAYEVINE
jgi:hypothetical protein